MYGDPMMHLIMGNDKEMSPEEMHQFWFERIDSTYVQMIEEAINNLKKKLYNRSAISLVSSEKRMDFCSMWRFQG